MLAELLTTIVHVRSNDASEVQVALTPTTCQQPVSDDGGRFAHGQAHNLKGSTAATEAVTSFVTCTGHFELLVTRRPLPPQRRPAWQRSASSFCRAVGRARRSQATKCAAQARDSGSARTWGSIRPRSSLACPER
jgi:hypothetical protein